MNRRAFLAGLFGTAVVAAAGTIPTIIEALPEKDFEGYAQAAQRALAEVYGNGKDYGFATLEYLNEAPWFKATPPKGFRPLHEESDRIGAEAIARMKSNG